MRQPLLSPAAFRELCVISGHPFLPRYSRSHFHIAPATAHAWLLQQLLDDAQTADPSGAAALQRAADLAPLADAVALPYKVVLVGDLLLWSSANWQCVAWKR